MAQGLRHATGTRNMFSEVAGCTVLAVGNDGYVIESQDGISWTNERQIATNSLTSICRGNGRFVTVGAGGNTMLVSDDGSTWRIPDVPANLPFHSVCHGDGKFVAIGTQTVITTSADGLTWVKRGSPTNGKQDICYGSGIFVIAVNYSAYYSTDAVNWTRASSSLSASKKICYGDGTFVVGSNPGNYLHTASATEIEKWKVTLSRGYKAFNSLCFGNGLFLAFFADAIFVSPDGSSWENTGVTPPASVTAACWNGSCFVAALSGGGFGYSPDGRTWTFNKFDGITYNAMCLKA